MTLVVFDLLLVPTPAKILCFSHISGEQICNCAELHPELIFLLFYLLFKFVCFSPSTRGIQKVLRQILKNTLFMKFTKLFFYIFC